MEMALIAKKPGPGVLALALVLMPKPNYKLTAEEHGGPHTNPRTKANAETSEPKSKSKRKPKSKSNIQHPISNIQTTPKIPNQAQTQTPT
jgi:hypothetical protein